MEQGLMPCPFCGGTVRLARVELLPDGLEGDVQSPFWPLSIMHGDDGDTQCVLWNARIPVPSEEAAAQWWNRRT